MRLGALTLSALFLVAQLAAFEHRLEVQHAVCAEHGEEIHTGSGTPGGDAPEVRQTQAAPEHGHDHCNAFLARREALAVSAAPAILLADVATGDPCVAPPAVATLAPVEVLRLAPKSSPPA